MKILFLLKKNLGSGSVYTSAPKSGLFNSATITSEELSKNNSFIYSKLIICVDANEIDKYVHTQKPDIVILEALWVTVDKMKEVQKLHPEVKFVVRIHSEIPFLAHEGLAIERIKGYYDIPNVIVSFNALRTYNDFKELIGEKIDYLPNIYYPIEIRNLGKLDRVLKSITSKITASESLLARILPKVINIGCFGAIRPLKNQLIH